MMSASYKPRTERSRRKVQDLTAQGITVERNGQQATFQLILPLPEMLSDVANAIEQASHQLGLALMLRLVEEEVRSRAGDWHAVQDGKSAVRWGKEQGHLVYAGQKVAVQRPRLRDPKTNRELSLETWQAFSHPARMEQSVSNQVLHRVSCRDYAGAVQTVCGGYGIGKSSVSRQWMTASAKQVRQLMERPLDNLDLLAIFLDGKEFQGHTVIVALGVDSQGAKHVLGLWSGATENSTVCGALLDDLIERGLTVDKPYLFVLDGSKALRKAVQDRWGKRGLIQRCWLHKQRNIESYLQQQHHKLLRMKLKAAFGCNDPVSARSELLKTVSWLRDLNHAAADSLEEGLEDLLTVHRLKVSWSLRRALGTTNLIESALSVVGELCRNVKRWRGESMARRWAGSALLEAQRRFHRVHGYQEIGKLKTALEVGIDTGHAVA
jgi:transposase-like protein